MVDTVVLVAGGASLSPAALEEVPTGAAVIAVDSGLDHALALGLEIDLVIGDLDSVNPASLEAIGDVPVERHPADKDATDLQLALDRVSANEEVHRVIVLGGHGGRLDHLLANAAVLASPAYSHLELEWVAGTARAVLIHDHARLHGTPGEIVTLLPMGGPVRGIYTEGLRWALADGTLLPGSSLGVSNELVRSVASVRITEGVLMAIQPEALSG